RIATHVEPREATQRDRDDIQVPPHAASWSDSRRAWAGVRYPRRSTRAKGPRHPLPDRLERRPAIADLRDVAAHHLGRVVIDCPEESAPALALGVEARCVRAPHLVGPRRDDRPRMRRVAVLMARAARRSAGALPVPTA